MIVAIQPSMAASFTSIMSLLSFTLGFEDWDRYTIALPYCLIIGVAIIRAVIVWMYGTLICCIDKKYTKLEDEEED